MSAVFEVASVRNRTHAGCGNVHQSCCPWLERSLSLSRKLSLMPLWSVCVCVCHWWPVLAASPDLSLGVLTHPAISTPFAMCHTSTTTTALTRASALTYLYIVQNSSCVFFFILLCILCSFYYIYCMYIGAVAQEVSSLATGWLPVRSPGSAS